MNLSLYVVTAVLLVVAFLKDPEKARMALNKAWKAFENMLPQILVVFLLVGFMMALLNPQIISTIIGEQSGWLGVLVAGSVGAITLIPGFVAFPTAALLLDNGAGYMQIGAFISALMMVGVVTMPVEIKYFGKKLTFYRNLLGFGFSFVVAYIIGQVVTRL